MKRLMLLVLCALLACGLYARPNGGGKAPDADITLPSGERVPLSSYAKSGKAVLLHFWATWCPPCREELPLIDAQAKRLKDKNSALQVLCVCVADTKENCVSFMEKYGYTFTSGLDPEGETASLYGVSGVPTSIIIGADGKVQKTHTGRMSEKMLMSFIGDYE